MNRPQDAYELHKIQHREFIRQAQKFHLASQVAPRPANRLLVRIGQALLNAGSQFINNRRPTAMPKRYKTAGHRA